MQKRGVGNAALTLHNAFAINQETFRRQPQRGRCNSRIALSPVIAATGDDADGLAVRLRSKNRAAYIETNPDDAGPQATLFRLMAGEFTGPVQVVEIDLPNGTARDVSVEFAERILQDRRLEECRGRGGVRVSEGGCWGLGPIGQCYPR